MPLQPEQKPTVHNPELRNAAYAGTWYPSDPERLAELLSRAWAAAESPAALWASQDPAGDTFAWPGARGILLPHPGLVYGAKTQAAGLRQGLGDQDADHVVILSPSHYRNLTPGRIYIFPYQGVVTPFGTLGHCGPESGALNVGVGVPVFSQDRPALDCEHGLESLLPILAWRMPQITCTLAVCAGAQTWHQVSAMTQGLRVLVESLKKSGKSRILLVASSDMSHWGSRFGDPLPSIQDEPPEDTCARLMQRDAMALHLLGDGGKELFDRRDELAPTMCGLIPALMVSRLLNARCRILEQSSSLDSMTPHEAQHHHSFVTYAAAGWEESP